MVKNNNMLGLFRSAGRNGVTADVRAAIGSAINRGGAGPVPRAKLPPDRENPGYLTAISGWDLLAA